MDVDTLNNVPQVSHLPAFQKTKNGWHIFTIFFCVSIFVVLVIAIVTSAVLVPHKHPTDEFTTYENTDSNLKCLKDTYQLGQPSGVLDYLSNQVSCDTPYNLLVQPDVTFKPARRGTGCTFVQLRYPG